MRENQKAAGERPDSRRNLRPTIGLLTAQISGELGTSFLTGVAEAAKERDANLITFAGGSLHCPLGFEAQGNVLYDLVTAEVVDGLVIDGGWLSHYVGPEALRDFCTRYGDLSLVSVEVPLEGIPSILTDFYQGMRDLMTHLIEVHGYRRIGFIRGPEESLTGEERYRAYQDALAEHDIPLDMDLVAPGTFFAPSGEEAVRLLLDERKVTFEALAAANDFMAIDAMRALQTRGIRIPGDAAVTGFDDLVASAVTPPLTTARLGNYERAHQAAEMLLARLRGEKAPEQVIRPAELVVRQSCGCQAPAVVQAAAGPVIRAEIGISLAAVLAAERETILSEIAEAVGDSSDGSVPQRVGRLLDVFAAELKGGSPGAFLAALEDILHQVVAEGGDVAAWQKAISALRCHALPYLAGEEASARAEDLWQQARVMIAGMTQQAEAYRRLQAEQQAAALREIGEATITTVEMKDLMDVAANGLPRLGIPRCTISLYEPDNEATAGSTGLRDQATKEGAAAPAKSKLMLAYEEGRRQQEVEGQVFPSRQLEPDGVLNRERRYSMVVESLHFREDQLGFALFEMGPREGAVYEALRGQISSALQGARRVQQVEQGQEYLRSLYQASGSIVSLRDPGTILRDITARTCEAVGGCQADIVLIDKAGQFQRLAGGGPGERVDTMTLVESMGISMKVMKDDKPVLFEDMGKLAPQTDHPGLEGSVGAAGCFPLRHRDKRIGVMWIFYPEPHQFSEIEVSALQLYVDQAAIAYDNAKRMDVLEHLRQAAEKLASVAGVQEVLRQIAKSAREVLQADSVVVWSYDAVRQVFLPDELVADGVDEVLLDRYREEEPRPGGTAAIVIQKGYLPVTDVNAPEYAYLNPPASGLRDAIGAKSFQGITLQVEGRPLGVLYANYRLQQGFDEDDRSTLEAFAYHAALALKKARLLEQVRRTHETAQVVARVSVLEELRLTLETVVEGTRSALSCDAVTLFVYNQVTDRLDHPPTMVGVIHPDLAKRYGEVLEGSIVYEMLRRDEPYIAEVVAQDALFRERRFVKDEKVESCVAIPLQAAGQKVGVMFVNYRTRHRFTGEELHDIELFAHQAAAAIRDAQLYEETSQRANALEVVCEAGKALTSTLGLDEVFNRIAEQARRLITGSMGEPARFSCLALVEENRLKVKAMCPPRCLPGPKRKVVVDLERDGRIGIMGRAVKTGESQLVPDVTRDSDYIVLDPDTRSKLVVPIKIGGKVIGVINVEHSDHNAFGREDRQALETLAAQAAVAIHNARLYEEITRQVKVLQGVYEAGKAVTSTLALDDILKHIVEQASRLTVLYSGEQARICYLALKEDGKLRFKAVYPPDHLPRSAEHIIDLEHDERIGIVGRAVKTGQSQLVPDVTQDPDYVAADQETRSELAVPIRLYEEVIGVIDVEHPKRNAFDEKDQRWLEFLAAQAAIAIQNARQYEELTRTKGMVGARTALAWMGMASSAWRHSIEGHAINIRNAVTLICQEVEHAPVELPGRQSIESKLDLIERLAVQILDKPITPPLSSEEGVDRIMVNDLISERVGQLWKNEPYQATTPHLGLRAEADVGVLASPEWLRRAFDLLVDNAIESMSDSPVRELHIGTRRVDDRVEIAIRDTGKGIPPDIRDDLFKRRIKQPEGSKGQGMGLLMVQAIVQTYEGTVSIKSTGPEGTTVTISLPVAAEPRE